MVSEIIWSPKAIETYIAIIEYLNAAWSKSEVEKFQIRVIEKLAILETHPRIGRPIMKGRRVYRTVLHKRITLVYHYYPAKRQIELITFWNNYQNPVNLNLQHQSS